MREEEGKCEGKREEEEEVQKEDALKEKDWVRTLRVPLWGLLLQLHVDYALGLALG